MFPFSKAIRFPILIFGKVTIKNVRKGRLVFNCPLTTGILQIGKRSLGFLDKHNCRTIWNVAGTLYVHGKASIGQGCCVEVEKDAVMTLGRNFNSLVVLFYFVLIRLLLEMIAFFRGICLLWIRIGIK